MTNLTFSSFAKKKAKKARKIAAVANNVLEKAARTVNLPYTKTANGEVQMVTLTSICTAFSE